MGETDRLLEAVSEKFFPANVQIDQAELQSRARRYEALTEVLLGLVITGCYWSSDYGELWSKALKRLANPSREYTGTLVWEGLRWYPPLLLIYGGGIASLSAERYNNLATLLLTPKVRVINYTEKRPAGLAISPATVFESSLGQFLPGMERNVAPVSHHLHKILREPLREILPQDDEYDDAFDRFEYLLTLIRADLYAKENVSDYFWERPGRFTSSRQLRRGTNVMDEVKGRAEGQKNDWPLVSAGFFDGSYERFIKVVKGCEENSGDAFR
jgi:hypothetical protein